METPTLRQSLLVLCAEIDELIALLDQRLDRRVIGNRLDLLKDKIAELLNNRPDHTAKMLLSEALHRLRHRRGSKATDKSHSGLFDCQISLKYLLHDIESVGTKQTFLLRLS